VNYKTRISDIVTSNGFVVLQTEVGFLMELFERVFQEQLNAMPE
jgi:hypothetical protein